jgi:hypothetical protein
MLKLFPDIETMTHLQMTSSLLLFYIFIVHSDNVTLTNTYFSLDSLLTNLLTGV